MEKEIKIITEGVLIIASSSKLKTEYADKEFDYDFPEGFLHLLNNNSVIALTTNGGDNLIITTQYNKPLQRLDYHKVIDQYVSIQDNDELLIMSHADFTMICSSKQGDYKNYEWDLLFAEPIKSGNYKLEIGINDVSEEFERYQAYFDIKINIAPCEIALKSNEVYDLADY